MSRKSMNLKHRQTILVACCFGLLMSLHGCDVTTPKALSPSEAHHKLVNILKEENNLTVVTKEFDRSLWIYLPFEEGFLELKAKKEQAAAPSPESTSSPTIYFLEGEFNGQDFVIRYDIGSSKKYEKDVGYVSAFSEEYQANQRNILTAISRAYSNFEKITGEDQLVERVPGDVDFVGAMKNADHKRMVHSYVQTDKAPDIFVIVMADIENGLELRIFLHLTDLRRAYTDPSFHGEYAKRVVSEQPFGDSRIIGDKTGEHVDFHNILLPEFLAKQMLFRINFKYTRSAFPPTDNPKNEILRAAAETVGSYGFNKFGAVELQDLSDGETYRIERKNLAEHEETPSEGRLIRIKFR